MFSVTGLEKRVFTNFNYYKINYLYVAITILMVFMCVDSVPMAFSLSHMNQNVLTGSRASSLLCSR